MHLRSLTLQAIGPFAAAHTIDFARLGAGGLFLLEGPTGAGKSTIIDAIVFALYGKVASAGASDDRLRSTHVAPDVESYVDLVLEVPAGVYRVRRSPAYDRPKQRGTGTTRQQTKVNLWQLSPADADAFDSARAADDQSPGTLLSSRADEVGEAIGRILGLSREQFVQTIVLPQGEFATFLRAKPEERSALLQKVFGTEIYQRIQNELVEARKTADRRVAAAEQTITTATASFVGAARLDAEAAAAVTSLATVLTADELLTQVDTHVTELRGVAEAASVAREQAAEVHAAASAVLDAARLTDRNVRTRDGLHAQQAALAADAEAHAARTGRLAAARGAAAVVPLLDELDLAVAAETKVAGTLGDARNDVADHPALAALSRDTPDLGPAPEPLGSRSHALLSVHARPAPDTRLDVPALRHEATRRRDESARLGHLVTLERGLAARRAEHATRTTALTARGEVRVGLAATLADRPAARATLAERLAALGASAALVATREADVAVARARLEAAEAVDALSPRIAAADAQVRLAAQAARDALDAEARLRRARIDGIAGELAAQLVDGHACAVCGSTRHPHPARRDADHVSPEMVDDASAAREAAETALAAAHQARATLDAELAARTAEAAGLVTAAAQDRMSQARAALADAQAAAAERTRVDAELAAYDTETARLHDQLADEDAAIAAEAAALAALGSSIDDDAAAVAAALAAHPTAHLAHESDAVTLADVVRDLDGQSRLLTHLVEAAADHERAHAHRARLDAEVAGSLVEHGFPDAAAVRDAALTSPETARLAEQVAAHESALAAVAQGLADPEIRALGDLTADASAATLSEATEAATQHAAALQSAAGAADVATATADAAAAAACGVAHAVDSCRAEAAAVAPVLRMANLASASTADNAAALTLSTYVLARRFDDVLAAANARLAQMSSGRYEVQRSTEKESRGGRRLGLALRVVDHVTETSREPATLSGGETFYVSLCLALGLADVVTAEAGGIDLGTLFVDEGFGSLDPTTLDLVMTELGRLRAGGRSVGVVSHVDAMKSTIADRISVRRQPDGTSTLAVLAGP